MKIKILYSFLFVFFVCVLAGQDTILVYYNKDGVKTIDKTLADYYRKAFMNSSGEWIAQDYFMSNKIRMTGIFSSKKLDSRQGHFVYYFENGKKKSEGECYDNLKEGPWKYWHENGEKHSEGKMLHNNKQGLWVYAHENGVKSGEGNYIAGKADNTWIYWHENGRKKSEGRYVNDQRINAWSFWNEQGDLECEEVYQNGSLSSKTWFHANGLKSAQGNISAGKKIGEWTFWNIDEKIYLKGSYLNGMQHGEWVRYFANGESMRIYYEDGIIKDKPLGQIIRAK